ncbi:hypothetical protein AB8Z38_36415 [Bradyrhizobium sp. LLZ17]|uniref:Uncharacterized protein n=1 Tax=Bradyrhizobium sp. LLZ17 TaxID=3239388 RepID=A0AB39XL37_9BRAD
MLAPDIAHLGIEDDVQHLKAIPKRGTSAHLQLEYFRGLRKFGRSPREAIGDGTKWLRTSTEAGDFAARAAEPKGTPSAAPARSGLLQPHASKRACASDRVTRERQDQEDTTNG